MVHDLGARLASAGVVTTEQLTRLGSPPSGGMLIDALVADGVWEDAIAGYLVANGFGPLGRVPETRDPAVADTVPTEVARELMAVPVGWRGASLVVAMADPSDGAALDRLRHVTGHEVVATLARRGDVARALASSPPPVATDDEPSADEAEVVLDLVRKRPDDEDPAEALPLTRPKVTAPQPVAAEADRWSSKPSEPPPPMDEHVLDAIAGAPDRDTAVDRACDAACTVARAAVFLALRKGMLQGFRGKGPGVSAAALGNLWVPVEGPSALAEVVRSHEAHDGPMGKGAADAVLAAATGMRSARLVIEPVHVQGRVVGVLCADRVRYEDEGARRLARIAAALGDALLRQLVARRA